MEHFTACAKKVLDQAEIYALKGGKILDSLHLLVALTEIEEGYASQILERFGFTKEIAESFILQIGDESNVPVTVTPVCREIMTKAVVLARQAGYSNADTQHILLSILFYSSSRGAKVLSKYKIDYETILSVVGSLTVQKAVEPEKKEVPAVAVREDKTGVLWDYGTDMIEKARKGEYERVIGREQETERLMRILTRKYKNNPILIGESGVGKTAVVEGLAQRIASGAVPDFLKDKILVYLDSNALLSGTRYRGDLEERVTKLFQAIEGGRFILFIDEIHTLMNTGGSENGSNIASLLKPALTRRITVIGATTWGEYKRYIEKDPAFERRFTLISVEEPNEKDCNAIMEGQKESLEKHYGVEIEERAVQSAVSLSKRYIRDRYLPDKALDLLEETCGKISVAGGKKVTEREVQVVLSEITGIPTATIGESMQEKLLKMEEILGEKIVGQKEAIAMASTVIRRAYAGITERKRPIASLLFIGPTGVGKTQTAKAIAEVLFGKESDMIRFDMSEYAEKNAISKLIGTSPGYIGYEEGGRLTDEVRKKPFSVILFDEIEKADKEIFNLFLQIMDDGRLTDGKGRRIDFCNTIIIMTGNIGTKEGEQINTIGFNEEKRERKEIYREEAEKFFPPEFINRLDSVIVFHAISKEDLILLSNNIIEGIKSSLKKEKGITLTVADNVYEYFATRSENEKYGARPLKRLIESFMDKMVYEIIEKGLQDCEIIIRISGGEPQIYNKGED